MPRLLVIIMKVLFLTSNKNKVIEANQTLSELGYEVEQFLIEGVAPKIIELIVLAGVNIKRQIEIPLKR